MPLLDTRRRPLRDLRVSLTDRCTLRCTYCMPREVFGPDHRYTAHGDLLTFDEITRVVAVFARLGVRTVRLTGGEPLLRPGVVDLVGRLAAVPGVDDLAMTTNGVALPGVATKLAHAGLGRVTVSLDALDAEVFAAMSDTAVPVGRVLDGIDAAVTAGLHPVKINSVVRRGVNEDQVVPLARYARERGVTIRFIEYMDVGHTNGWSPADVVPAGEILARVAAAHPLEPSTRDDPSATAVTYRYRDGAGEVGMVASVTQPFCGSCTRARLSPAGELFTCLFASRGTDVRGLLRGGADDDALLDRVGGTWTRRADRYSETRADRRGGRSDRVEMSYIGG